MKTQTPFSLNVIYYSAIAALILFSFFSFSYRYYPFFNADAALAVLMSYDYHFPKDLYCWGQDRGGTLEMMIAHFFISLFHSSPLITSSVIHYILLVAGLVASFHFVRKPFFRLALTVAWFFPSHFFIESVLYQFGVQFSLFMMGLYFLSKSINSGKRKSLFLSLLLFFMILNVWVLDLGIIPVFFLALLIIISMIFQKKMHELTPEGMRRLFTLKNCIICISWTIAGILFISYAKINASQATTYNESGLNNPRELVTTATSLFNSILVSFRLLRKPTESFYFYSVIGFLVAFALHFRRKNEKHIPVSFFRTFFLCQAAFGVLLLLFSKQVLLANLPVRYFGGAYLSIVLFLLMKLETIEIRPLISISLSIVLAASILSSLYESYFPKKLAPMVKNFPMLDSLQPVGIIGSYWNSYVFSAIDPVNIKATPHDRDNVRNRDLALETLMQPRLLLIQNEWLEKFPDSISQFGSPLRKKGGPFLLGTYISWNEVNDVIACEYIK
ncbi:MAG: hypothetical protein NTV09_05735 [Bacteroidetes bacterium]|nr:hypothetical protein [Bacteroidota bacterium]